jgi:OOP family OmpA-OmpF porin
MRSNLIIIGLAAIGAVACVKADPYQTCHPVASWSSPTYRCMAAAQPVAAPAPVIHEAEPAPPEPPAPRASISEEQIDLMETVQFETDSAVLVDRSKSLLDEVGDLLNKHPEITKVRIEGHTDSKASPKHNMKLSQDRAASVQQYLVDHGVAADRLTTKGFGETKPIADNGTEEGRAKNRRVDFKIVKRTNTPAP